MKKHVHALAGVFGFAMIAVFWSSTVIFELFGSHAAIATVKNAILWGMTVLIPAMLITGASGMALGRQRGGRLIQGKKRRMPVIALNGLLILVPSAIFLADRAAAGVFDGWFYGIQGLELIAGAINLSLMGLNIRDGLTLSGRTRKWRQSRAGI